METEYLLSVDEFCIHHDIDASFISSLQETGLIEITTVKETVYINADQLLQLEKFIRLYNELDINIEGIETITHLLERVKSLKDKIIELENRLRLYEVIE
jgi:hypothetical protein